MLCRLVGTLVFMVLAVSGCSNESGPSMSKEQARDDRAGRVVAMPGSTHVDKAVSVYDDCMRGKGFTSR
jgi:hypothetical protein